MKEININIEGYNVNGICVGCLNYNRKMYYHKDIHNCFKNLANIDVPDGLSIQVCYECLAAVRNANRFREQILKAYDILMDYSAEHTFLNAPSDLSQYSVSRLSLTALNLTNVGDLGVEPIVDDRKVEIELDVKSEMETELGIIYDPPDNLDTKPETDYSQDTILDYPDIPDVDIAPSYSSDEDIQLSLLKRKKERVKKGRKSKKEKKSRKDIDESEPQKFKMKEEQPKMTRKLKNLPENMVSLYTMTEEEMWQVRSEDLASKEFESVKYKCVDCIIGFNTERLMIDHMSGKHQPKSGDCKQCDVCKAYFLTKDNLATHRALHLTAYHCLVCSHVTSLKMNMSAHVATHTGTSHACNTCQKTFSTKSKLSYHKNVCHQEKPQCDCCGKVFANKMTLKYHLKILPQNKEEKPKEKLYIPCKGCNKVFYNKKSYRAHVVIHNGVTYPCPVCGKLFQWKRNLARHTRAHREREAGARHECRPCGKVFASRDCLMNHQRLSKRHVPDADLNHECNYCGKKFATKYCMVDHIDWDHLKRIKYQCSVCFKAFKTSKIMVAHMNNIHEGKKNKEPEGEHLCEICGKSYKTVKRLKGHVWAMHTNRSTTKSFKCSLCPATFTWQTSIYKHTKMMHSTGKRAKQQQRPLPPIKKQEQFELDPTRVHYYPSLDMNHMSQSVAIIHNLG